jgi:hypothetical protein
MQMYQVSGSFKCVFLMKAQGQFAYNIEESTVCPQYELQLIHLASPGNQPRNGDCSGTYWKNRPLMGVFPTIQPLEVGTCELCTIFRKL